MPGALRRPRAGTTVRRRPSPLEILQRLAVRRRVAGDEREGRPRPVGRGQRKQGATVGVSDGPARLEEHGGGTAMSQTAA